MRDFLLIFILSVLDGLYVMIYMKNYIAVMLAMGLFSSACAETHSGWWMPNEPGIPIQLTPLEVCEQQVKLLNDRQDAWNSQNPGYRSPWRYYSPSVEQGSDTRYPNFICLFRTSNPNIYPQPIGGSSIRDAFPGCERWGCH